MSHPGPFINPTLPPPCNRCRYIPEILDYIPAQDISTELTRSGYIPPPVHPNTIHAAISFCDDSIDSLEQEIYMHQAAAALLQERLENIRRFRRFQRSLLFPIPDEVLQEIFSYACNKPASLEQLLSPVLVIQQVCARWRRLARCTPRLWRSFEIHDNSAVSSTTLKLRVGMCLEFSGNMPLLISVRCRDSTFMHEFPEGILAEIAEHSDRWHSFSINGSLVEYTLGEAGMGKVMERGFPQLRRLYFYKDRVVSSKNLEKDIFTSAHNLQEVVFRKMNILPNIHWANVRKLSIVESAWPSPGDNSLSVFCNMPSLEVLEWKDNFVHVDAMPQNLIATIPLLHTLCVEPSAWAPETFVWLMLRMPSLTHLQIRNGLTRSELNHIVDMILASGATIKKLYLEWLTFNSFIHIIQEFSDAQEFSFTIPEDEVVDQVELCEPIQTLQALIWEDTPPPDRENVLPSLQRLKFQSRTLKYYPDLISNLKAVLHSRSPKACAERLERNPPAPSPLPLLFMSVDVMLLEPGYEPKEIIGLGKELGIEVEVALTTLL